MCPKCGDENLIRREEKVDLNGYNVLITGARIKIGFHTALRFLRNGANVISTSRFPHSTLLQYANEPDFQQWSDRLRILGLDLLRIDLLENFISEVYQNFDYLDVLVNNAAQTVKNNIDIQTQIAIEKELSNETLLFNKNHPHILEHIASHVEKLSSYAPNSLSVGDIELTDDNQNAWVKKSADVSIKDLLETQIINVTAPYLLSTAFKPLLEKSPHSNRFLINVSSLEGKFSVKSKSSSHPHTNMAKAALNMMTKTLASEYRRNHIYIYSIDPGWVSDQFPKREGRTELVLPLEFEDAAARITHPVFTWKETEKPPTGIFIKDYIQTEW